MAVGKVFNNLIGASKKAKYPAVQGSELSVNMYYAKNGSQEYMESLPGLQYISTIGGRCRGAYVSTIGLSQSHSTEDLFVAQGNAIYRMGLDGSKTKLGNIASNGMRVSFAETGGPTAYLLACDGSSLWAYNLLEGGELQAVQLPERPFGDGGTIRPSHVAVVAGSIAVNDVGSGYVYYSKPYPLNSEKREMYEMEDGKVVYKDDGVTPKKIEVDSIMHVFEDEYGLPKYFNGESSSDSVNAIYAVSGLLYLMGPKSCEIWQRGSGEYEDWLRVSYTVQSSFGLEAPASIASCGNTLYFIASGQQYGKSVLAFEGTTPRKISDDWLDERLLLETSSAVGFCYSVNEHQFYVLQLNSLGETWVYDSLDGGWHKRVSRDKNSGSEIQWRVGCVSWWRSKFFAFTNDGLFCGFHRDYWYEDFSENEKLPMIRHRQTAVITNELKPFTFEELAVECNVGTWEDYELKPMLLLEVSKDGGNTFGNVRSASLGRTGNYSHRVRWLTLGLNRLCVIRLTYSHPTDLVLTYCSIRAEQTGAMI